MHIIYLKEDVIVHAICRGLKNIQFSASLAYKFPANLSNLIGHAQEYIIKEEEGWFDRQ